MRREFRNWLGPALIEVVCAWRAPRKKKKPKKPKHCGPWWTRCAEALPLTHSHASHVYLARKLENENGMKDETKRNDRGNNNNNNNNNSSSSSNKKKGWKSKPWSQSAGALFSCCCCCCCCCFDGLTSFRWPVAAVARDCLINVGSSRSLCGPFSVGWWNRRFIPGSSRIEPRSFLLFFFIEKKTHLGSM